MKIKKRGFKTCPYCGEITVPYEPCDCQEKGRADVAPPARPPSGKEKTQIENTTPEGKKQGG